MSANTQIQSGFVSGILAPLGFGFDRVKDVLKDLSPEQLTYVPAGLKNSIATLALHLAATEIKFAYGFTGQEIPADLADAYLTNLPTNPLPAVTGETAESLTEKLEKARAILLEAVAGLTDADLDREFTLPSGRTMSNRFLLTILPQHQGQHYGHMQYIKQLLG